MGTTVKLTQSVDDRAVVQAFERQLKLLDKLERRLDDSGGKGNKSGERTATSWLNANRALNLAGTATQKLIESLEKAYALQHKVRTEAATGSETFDAVARRFFIQQGAGGLSLDQIKQEATRIGTEAGVSQQAVLRIAKQLTSTGFKDPLARGGSAEGIIEFLQSTAQPVEEADLEAVVSGFAQQLTSSKQALTPQNLRRIALQTRGLFSETSLEATDLPIFGSARQVATQLGVNQTDFLSAATVVKEKFQTNPEAGATGLGNFFLKLAARKKLQLGAIQELGLKPEQLDFVGETVPQVAKTLATAIDALPEERRTAVTARLFGADKSQIGAALALIDAGRTGDFKRLAGLQSDVTGYETGVNVARTSQEAARKRVEVQIAQEQALYTEAGGASELTLEKSKELRDIRRRRVHLQNDEGFQGAVENFLDANLPRIEGDYTSGERSVARQAAQRGGGFTLEQQQMQQNNQILQNIDNGIRNLNRNGPPERELNRRD